LNFREWENMRRKKMTLGQKETKNKSRGRKGKGKNTIGY
jgi:hypothetical protein